ncbi:MAG: hypothetical protein OK452_07340 [Thaumarchaeota archaeon]|nr:hypothetical protein [Nitrososphaerota archaeon]
MTDTSSDYYAALATTYRDLVTLVFAAFGFLTTILLGLIAAEVSRGDLVAQLNGDVELLVYAVGVLIILIIVLGFVILYFDWKAAQAKKAEPAH